MKKIIILITIILLLSGCWNYQELNDYAIVTGMAVDYDEEKEQYKLSLLIANGNKTEDETAQVTILNGEGKSIYESYKNASLVSPKELYISHLSVLLLSEEIAKMGLETIIDFLMRQPQVNQNMHIIVVKDDKAKDALAILTPLADYPSQGIASNVNVTEKLQGRVTDASFSAFVSKLLEKGITPVVNSIIIVGDAEKGTKKEDQQNSIMKAYTKLNTLGIFKKDKLVDWATEEESIGINILLGDVYILYLTIPCTNGNMVISTESFKLKNDVNNTKIKTSIDAKGIISETTCKIDLEDEHEIKKLEKKVENKMIDYMEKAINLAKNNEVDIFGYGSMIYKKDPHYFNSIDNWDKEFINLDIELDVNFTITEKGSLEKSLGEFKL